MNDTKNNPTSEQVTNNAGAESETAAAVEPAVADDTTLDVSNADPLSPVADQESSPADTGAAAGPEVPSVEDQIVELRDRLLRAMAELENTRKRAERDREEAGKYAITGFARSILSVADNLRRAIDAVPDEARENESTKVLLDGVEITERELLKAFEQHGIKSIVPLGEKFDHNFHQAMFEVEASGQPPGTIVQVMEAGYVIAGRLLRPATVGIAKAPAPNKPPNDDQARVDTKV
ncbi:MAG: nucleotide exchange factor GrpE [Proteobacteria bacterium]|nr:nucleotide exchange factor GrpE [Pseudomonadota bacterium]